MKTPEGVTRMKFVLTKQLHFYNIATKMKYCTYKNCLVSISIWKVCELAFIVKLQEFTELWQSQMIQVYVPPFKFCVLNWAEISYMNRQQNSSCQLRQPIYWAQMKRPLELHFFFDIWHFTTKHRIIMDTKWQSWERPLWQEFTDLLSRGRLKHHTLLLLSGCIWHNGALSNLS